MSSHVYRLLLPLEFPEGVAPGEGRNGNHLFLARDGSDRPVLRGSALAGALRHGWMDLTGSDDRQAAYWFGEALNDNKGGTESPLRVPDSVLNVGEAKDTPLRTHIAKNRHWGVALSGGLFTLEALPPGTKADVCLWLHEPERDAGENQVEPNEFLAQLVALFQSGLFLGGNSARGIGRAVLREPGLLEGFDCKDIQRHAAMLDEQYRLAQGQLPATGQQLKPNSSGETRELRMEVCLGIPRGEDLLVADGLGMDHEMEPQWIKCADGQKRWMIPGSSLRGVLRAWFTRLAAHENMEGKDRMAVADHAGRAKEDIAGKDIRWGWNNKNETREEKLKKLKANLSGRALDPLDGVVECPIMRLFGSFYSKSRIHVSDAFSNAAFQKSHEQVRMHVAVDRITGGANDGALFDNTVLAAPLSFMFTITIRDPEEHEAGWLYSALRAIDLGILCIGSSKASGRLKLIRVPSAMGNHSSKFSSLVPSEV